MTLNKLRLNKDEKGFTLIELMIVIAIIGILAAIAIPNFISYRDKAYCSAAEADANSTAAAIADYYAIPTHVTIIPYTDLTLTPSGSGANANTVTISGTVNAIVITVTDGSGRCPTSYTGAMANWTGSVYTKTMQ